ncbi:AAA family ATPase [Oceanobacillus oncorhynchi subsp. oncorhynchi]|uniref:hypothetical protein n=1 Tax=Oceanobacillus oncorhynchi TaxID=545501 RepID=UPI0031D7E946
MQVFKKTVDNLNEAKQSLLEVKSRFISNISKSEWLKEHNNFKEEYEKLQKVLDKKELNLLENLQAQGEKLEEKEKELQKLKSAEPELKLEVKNLSEIKREFLLKRKEITSLRINFLKKVLGETNNIKIEVKPFRDDENYESEFRKIIQKENTYTEDVKDIVTYCFNGKVEKTIEEIRNDIYNVKYDGEDSKIASRRFSNSVIKELNDEQIDRLQLLYPEDRIEVKYKANNSSSFKSISNASAGQKTSAVLTFLLSYGNSPLILDQPEDDLDNQLIYDLIVNRLKSSKQNRL